MKTILIFTVSITCALSVVAEEPALEEGFFSIFNGKDLTGWEGDTALWRVEDGLLIGRSPGIEHNNFLASTERYGDFILRFQFRLVDGKGNSGVQFRSERVPDSSEVSGYQADIGPGWWGTLYDESRRNKPLVRPDKKLIKRILKPKDWNDYEITAIGNKITLAINGTTVVEYTEEDPNIARSGIIAPQIHSGPPLEVQFKHIRIKVLK